MNAPFKPEAYPSPHMSAIRELLKQCDDADQLSLLSDLIYGTHCPMTSDRFQDALAPVSEAFEGAYDGLSFAVSPGDVVGNYDDRLPPSFFASARG